MANRHLTSAPLPESWLAAQRRAASQCYLLVMINWTLNATRACETALHLR